MVLAMLILGVALGSFITVFVVRTRSPGSLMVDTSDPDGPYLFLKLRVDPSTVLQKKYVTLSVKLVRRNSQN